VPPRALYVLLLSLGLKFGTENLQVMLLSIWD